MSERAVIIASLRHGLQFLPILLVPCGQPLDHLGGQLPRPKLSDRHVPRIALGLPIRRPASSCTDLYYRVRSLH